MKKVLLVLLSVLVFSCLVIYIFIPGKINITSSTIIPTTDIGVERFITDENKWEKWWNYNNPHANPTNPEHAKAFISNRDTFKLFNKYYKSADIWIHTHERELVSKLVIISLTQDSTGIEWASPLLMGSDPYTRLTRYLQAKNLKKSMDTVLANLKAFLSKSENIYGIPFERNRLKDTLYFTAKNLLQTRPSTTEIYGLIKKLQSYASKNSIKQTGNPIYNITEMDKNRFQLMAAIPVEKSLKEADGFSMKHMVKGSFIISEVVGGDSAVSMASKNLHQYFQDFHKTSMAMNFTMLVTDRILQTDSSKWITRLYMPVY